MPQSDLPVRAASGLVMIVVAGAALCSGGLILALFLGAVSVASLVELVRIANALPWSRAGRIVLTILGVVYIGAAVILLWLLRAESFAIALAPIIVTIATDVGAYFAGRTIGGPKIAPAISPSKTWAGLAGGVLAAGFAAQFAAAASVGSGTVDGAILFISGGFLAIVAQLGDFGESFLKRQAGLKDSGALIPGHGGVLDRIDGLLAVVIVFSIGLFVVARGI